jgi:hypothetical protein
MIREKDRRALAIFNRKSLGFSGFSYSSGKDHVWLCSLSHENAVRLREQLRFTGPTSLRDHRVTFGVGDRLGIATPGHIRVLRIYEVSPVLAQQSPRELELAGRNYADIVDPATWAVLQEGYGEPWGADGDHLKTTQWVYEALSQGCTMITADLTDHIHTAFEKLSGEALKKAYMKLSPDYREEIEQEYLDKPVKLDTGETILFNAETLARVSLVYHKAVAHARDLYEAGTVAGDSLDFEVSIDETDIPTSPEAHVFVARELGRRAVPFVSLAPRFVGRFEKAVDYAGDLDAFKNSFAVHCAIARRYGHKVSIHSGSDKFSMYPLIGEMTELTFHIKTCGTSWLEALSVVAEVDPALFRNVYSFAVQSLPLAAQHYKTVASPEAMIDVHAVGDLELPSLVQSRDERQVLHITYGQILSNRDLKHRLLEVLNRNLERYWQRLEHHIGRHLHLLGVKKR